MTTPKYCPNCKAELDDIDIYQHFYEQYKDEAKAIESASHYGWTKESPICFSRCIGIYCREQDRTIQRQCPDCDHVWDCDWYAKHKEKDETQET